MHVALRIKLLIISCTLFFPLYRFFCRFSAPQTKYYYTPAPGVGGFGVHPRPPVDGDYSLNRFDAVGGWLTLEPQTLKTCVVCVIRDQGLTMAPKPSETLLPQPLLTLSMAVLAEQQKEQAGQGVMVTERPARCLRLLTCSSGVNPKPGSIRLGGQRENLSEYAWQH